MGRKDMALKQRQNFMMRLMKDNKLRTRFFAERTFHPRYKISQKDFKLMRALPRKALDSKAKGLQNKVKKYKMSWDVKKNIRPLQ